MTHAIMIRDITDGTFRSATEYFAGTEGFEDEIVEPYETDALYTGVSRDSLAQLVREGCDFPFDDGSDHYVDPDFLGSGSDWDPFLEFVARENGRRDKYARMAMRARPEFDIFDDHGFHTGGVLAVDCWGNPEDDWYDDDRFYSDRSVLAVGLTYDMRHEFEVLPEDEDDVVDYEALAEQLGFEEELAVSCQCGSSRQSLRSIIRRFGCYDGKSPARQPRNKGARHPANQWWREGRNRTDIRHL